MASGHAPPPLPGAGAHPRPGACAERGESALHASSQGARVLLAVENMTCGKCVGRVERALKAVGGVEAATVDLAAGTASVEAGARAGCPTVFVRKLLAALEEGGYPAHEAAGAGPAPGDCAANAASAASAARGTRVELAVGNMTCGKCVGRVERALKAVAGVEAARVDLAAGRAWVDGGADAAAMISVLHDAGYPARVVDAGGGERAGGGARVELAVDNMTCGKCVGRVERALRALPGLVRVTYTTRVLSFVCSSLIPVHIMCTCAHVY